MPHWTVRGTADDGTFADGGRTICGGGGIATRCVRLNWQFGWSAYGQQTYRVPSWHGSLIEDKRDGTGLLYRRSRYLDPNSGQFTQEDPIGLAGGMNLYGFANGDPVNHSDPFGLTSCPPECGEVFAQLGRIAPAINREVATFLPKNLAAALGGTILSKVAGAVASRLTGGTASVAVVHFTSTEGAAAIEASGALRAGSFVALPSEVAGLSVAEVETFLEISAGKGAMRGLFRVPPDALKLPFNGPVTSGGASAVLFLRQRDRRRDARSGDADHSHRS